ncbi:type VI secretion system tip protein VgrG [Ramlibacter sp. WS9]|uniref:type VI secretion system tip protein VgrG n=1 Tax=Ramlibacter sp. WS9 TaxID=1882741 RepID=UPI00114130BD|nr:type VI secretion system tip protein VgrG [Ramlibacter sp. WS9]ROZ72670.1 type VI secretion system tip protein VgrG [Ramlibacter sp. WS9]
MAPSPNVSAEGVMRITVSSNGTKLPETVGLVSVTVSRAANAIPFARLVVADGDMAAQLFPVGDGELFKPGSAITIKAGYQDEESTIFEGIVVRQGLKITGQNFSRLVIECRDKAAVMTVGRKNANYVDQKDSDILSTLFSDAGLATDIGATALQHKELVQYYCTDWDFAIARAEANGMLVVVTDGKAVVKVPDMSAASALSVTYGIDLIEFDADIDARSQLASAQGFAWDPKTQATIQGTAATPPSLNKQGDLKGSDLAKVLGVETYRLQTPAPLESASLKTWADAQQLKAGLARVRGRMKFQGSALAQVGGLIDLAGVGTRFSGSVFVTAVDHELTDGNWWTQVEFGMSPMWFTQRADVQGPSAAGLLPGVEGLQIGVVMKLDADPEGEQRVQVSVPVMQAETDGVWARLAQLHASDGFGTFFVPEIGDEVLLGYLNNDPSYPVILGSVYSSKRKPPYELTAQNNIKAVVTRCKSKIEFNEEDKIITVLTPAGNTIVLSDKDKSILMKDQNNNKVELNPSGITLDSPKDILVTAKGTITLDAVGAVTVTSKSNVKTSGLNVDCVAQVGFSAKGAATAELSATGQTTVKGALVMIN